jgi:putative ABC transport system permease protein
MTIEQAATLPKVKLDRPRESSQLSQLMLALRFAFRNLRGGVRGFLIFLSCILLGVASITAVSVLSRGLTEGLAREGRVILGADLAFVTIQREAEPTERQFFAAKGAVSEVAYMRIMARKADGTAVLSEGKAVQADWPRFGPVVTEPKAPINDLLALKDGRYGVVADPLLFTRLDVKPGDRILIGNIEVDLRAAVTSEPDKLAGGLGFGPRLLLSTDALRASGLIQPGSLMRWSYRIAFPDAGEDRAIDVIIAESRARFPQAGWDVRSRMNASPQFARQVERFTQFLTLIGLTSLLIGGVGVANAVRGFVERRWPDIATMKSLGATGSFAVLLLLTEVLMLAVFASALGILVGAGAVALLVSAFGHLLPLPLDIGIHGREIGQGMVYGLLTTLAFALWPLGRAHDIGVAALFRSSNAGRTWPRWRYVILTAFAIAALVSIAIYFSYDRRIAMLYVCVAAAAFVLLRLVSAAIMAMARRVPHPRRADARLALANLYRPGALTPSVTLSLGLGLTLLVTLGLTDVNLRRQLQTSLPERAPSFFFIDIPSAEGAAFEAFLKEQSGEKAVVERVPMMRGRIVNLKGIPAETYAAEQSASWALEGDRGITYSATIPAGSKVIEGAWWPENYRGTPQVSMTRDIANGLRLQIGDKITVNVLGRNLTAELASIRQVEWRSVGINFVMVFSPNTFAGAPHTQLSTLTVPGVTTEREAEIARAVSLRYPAISSVRVRDALQAASDLVGQLTLAMRGASGVALLASVLVLGGALAAGRAQRIKDAVILKTLGATRSQLLSSYLMEYAMLGLIAAIFGLIAGVAAAYGIAVYVMRIPFSFEYTTPILAIAIGITFMIGFGLAGTWKILGNKPSQYLREN